MTSRRLLVASALTLGLLAGRAIAATKVTQITFERSNAVVTVAGEDGSRRAYDFRSINAAIAAYAIGSSPGGAAGVSWVVDEAGGKDADYLAIDLALVLDPAKSGTHVMVEKAETITTTAGTCRRVTLAELGVFDACDSRMDDSFPDASATLAILQAASLEPNRATLQANAGGTSMQLRFQLVNRLPQ
jgi:hypothetical protein